MEPTVTASTRGPDPLVSGDPLAASLGALVVFGVAVGLTALPGGRPPASVTVLVLVAVVVAVGGLGGKLAGAVAAVMASLCFNFFHTEPYLSLRIHGGADVVTFLLLLAVGLGAGSLAGRAADARALSRERRSGITAVHRVAELAAAGASAEVVRAAVERALVAELDLAGAEHRAGPVPDGVPRVGRRGTLDLRHYRYTGHGFEIPETGLALPVARAGAEVGWFHLTGRPGAGVTKDDLLVAVTLADLVALPRPS